MRTAVGVLILSGFLGDLEYDYDSYVPDSSYFCLNLNRILKEERESTNPHFVLLSSISISEIRIEGLHCASLYITSMNRTC